MTERSGGHLKMVAMVLVALGVAVSLLALLAVEPVDAASRFKIVKKTFSNSSVIQIPAGAPTITRGAAAPYPSEITAGGFKKGKIRDVNLTLKNFSHTYTADVDVLLAHRGQTRTVMSDVPPFNAFGVKNVTLILDDEATDSLPDDSPLTGGGRFKPANLGDADAFPAPAPTPSTASKLSGFNGLNPSGPWTLWVVDDDTGDVGQFAGGWSITIKARVRR